MPAWLAPLLPLLVAKALPIVISLLGSGALWIGHRYLKNKKLLDALDWLSTHVGPVVAAVEQTYVDGVTANGTVKLSPGQRQAALDAALKAILAQMPPSVLEILDAEYPNRADLEAFITTLIEGAVKTLEVSRQAGRVNLTALAVPAKASGTVPSAPAPFVPPEGSPLENPKANSPK